ncbi:MAG: hydroxymethylglutaryl-CoA lyase [Acidobacteriota bacterium]
MTLPKAVELIEVGPRDGFQAEETFLPTELKVVTLKGLASAGLKTIEVTSFVHPKVIPQMVDAAQVMAAARELPGVHRLALVPNLKGAERALEAGAQGLRLVVCVTETYNRRNVGLSVQQSLDLFGEIVTRAHAAGATASAVLAVAFGCPFEGEVPIERVVELARRFLDLGSDQLGLADSAGLGNPVQTRALLRAVRPEIGDTSLWLHLHDTRGMALANTLVALEEGVTRFDTSLGGLGGCPIMRGATGNLATEDLAYACREMGIETGIDLDPLRQTSRRIQSFLGRPLASRVLQAGTAEEVVARHRSEDGKEAS